MGVIIDSKKLSEYEVLTDIGFEDIKSINKTIKYQIYSVKTQDYNLKCSFNHILFDKNMNEIFTEDLHVGDKIHTKKGFQEIISIDILAEYENMYDLELYEGNRRYFTNDITSHNTHIGKTSNLIALGANFLKNGENVLYITLEMSEEKIAQRFDANYLGVDINDVPLMKEKSFRSKLKQIQEKVSGQLIIKEYAPGNTGVNKLRSLIEDLKIKQNFDPKIVIVDYLNLMVSDRIKTDSLYSNGKAIAEELRGLGVDGKYCVLTATQGNREMNSENTTDADFTNVSESKAVMDTSDTSIAILMPGELREQNTQIWKILKNRYGGIVNHKIPLKVNFSRAMLYESEENLDLQGNSHNEQNLRVEKTRAEKRNKIKVDVENSEIEDELEELMGEEND